MKKYGNYKHGKSYTKVYEIWKGIRRRCYTESCKDYKDYGGRGISMKKDWISCPVSFEEYVTSLNSYKKDKIGRGGLSLDRIDNDGNYEEGNLRWATLDIQNRNKRLHPKNTSGYYGVYYNKEKGKYQAQISVKHKMTYIGRASTAKAAHQLRLNYIKDNNLKGFNG